MAHKIASEEMIEVKRRGNRERQADYRERVRLATTEVTADEFFDAFHVRFPAQHAAISKYAKEFEAAVARELGVEKIDDVAPCSPGSEDIVYTLDRVATILYCFQHDVIHRVTLSGTSAEFFGGTYYADVLGDKLVKETHRFDLERSATYSAAYRELLGLLDRRYGRNNDENSNAVRAELGRINNGRS